MKSLDRTAFSPLLQKARQVPVYWWQALGVLLLALGLRLLFLDLKPPHFDEGINGWFVDQMWRQGFYRYDPTNYHGPLYFYVLQLSELLGGRGIVALRLPTALISTAIIAIVLLHGRWFGRAALWAGLALAVSPAMVFYGRYAIHESLFVCSQALFLYGFIRWRMEGGRYAVVCMAAGLVGSIATKETFFIFFGTWFIALGLVALLKRFFPESAETAIAVREPVTGRFVVTTVLVSLLCLLALFSGFFANPPGIRDMVMAFAPWVNTGIGDSSGHEKPFVYWLQLLARYEWPMLLTLLTMPLLLAGGSRWSWRLGATGFGLLLAYSLIPYKTPWLIIGILLPLGFAFGFLLELARTRLKPPYTSLPTALGFVVLAASLTTAVRLNFKDYADLTEPYVYVHTTTDVTRFMGHLEHLVEQQPAARNVSLLVLINNPWPLPWLLGRYPGLAYGTVDSAADITADVVLVEQSGQAKVESAMRTAYIRLPLRVRDAAEDGWVYYRLDRFREVILPGIEIIAPVSSVVPQ
jgi:uncharacterized protein (TIGR03663 family)